MYKYSLYIISFFFIVAAFLSFPLGSISFDLFLLIVVGGVLVIFIFHRVRKNIFRRYIPDIEKLEESVNLLEEEVRSRKESLEGLPEKAEKIFSLSKVVDDFTSLVDREKIYDFLVENLGHFFSNADSILLFVFNRDNDSLELIRSLRRREIVIKEKRGDIMDWWVLRNNQSLIVENFTGDFRFDYRKSNAFKERGVHSFIVSPISLGEKLIGVLRVENRRKGAFSMDDLRILRIFCDVGAAVLERAQIFCEIEKLATKDALTDLFLKNVFEKRLKEEIKRARITKTKLALGILDIDNFKKINDTYGHGVGDLVLKKTADILIKVIGDSGNMVSRFGGEEFVFFVVRAQEKEVRKIAQDIIKEIRQTLITFRRKAIRFTASIGMVIYPDDTMDYEELMEKADKLLYKAKREGKNKACLSF